MRKSPVDLNMYCQVIECAILSSPPAFNRAKHALREAEQAYLRTLDVPGEACDQEVLSLPLGDLGISQRAVNALECRAGAVYVRDLIGLSASRVAEWKNYNTGLITELTEALGESFCRRYNIMEGWDNAGR